MRKYHKNAQALGGLVENLIQPIVQDHGAMTYGIITNWPQIIGVELAQDTAPEKFIWSRQKSEYEPATATLCILTNNGGTALKLQHMQTHILARVNAQFGWRAVTAIKIKQTLTLPHKKTVAPKPTISGEIAAQIATHIQPDTDPELANVLQRLGQSILREEQRK